MALSGSFYAYAVNSFGLYCTWSAVQNIPGYYSDVAVNVYLQHYSIKAGARANSPIKCGSETYYYTAPSLSYASGTALTKTLLGSHTFRVYHDAGGGTKTVPISASWVFNGTYSGTYVGTITASASISLDAIPQQSAISSIVVEGRKVTVNLTRYVSTFTHVVKFVLGSYSHEVAVSGTSTNYTIPLDWFNAIPNSVTGVGTVQVTTYSGTSPIGHTVSKEFVITVPDTVIPAIGGISWTKTSSEPSSWPITKGVSTGTMTMTGVAGAYGSTIVSRSLTFAGLSSNTATLTVNGINIYGTLQAVAKVTDSRGRSGTKTVDFTVADYTKPTLVVTAFRCDNTGAEDASGDFFFIKATAGVTAIGNNLLDQLILHYKKKTDSSYEQLELTSGEETILIASSDSTWEWMVVAADWVNSVTVSGVIPTGEVVFDILANGKGIKFGGVAEKEGFDSAWDFMKNGVPQVDFVMEQGTVELSVSGIWVYRKWHSGTLEVWNTQEFSFTASPNAVLGGYYSSYSLELPALFSGTPRSFVQGKIGTGIGFVTILSSSKTHIGVGVFGNQNGTTSYITSVYAIGRWK